MGSTQTVDMALMVEKLNLKNLTPDIDLTGMKLASPEINRPALQLAGYFAHFATERVQIVGYVEYTYLQNMPLERKIEIYRQYLSYEVPCTIFCSLASPDPEFLELARRIEGKPPIDFPQETAIGALALYISHEGVENFQPMNVNFGIMPPLGYRVKGKRNKNAALSQRALEALDGLDWR